MDPWVLNTLLGLDTFLERLLFTHPTYKADGTHTTLVVATMKGKGL